MNINTINDNSIIITTFQKKMELLNKIKSFSKIKIFTKEEFLKEFFFEIDKNSILILSKQTGYDYEFIKILLNNLFYQSNTVYFDKMKNLNKILTILKNEKLVINNNYFQKFLSNKKIYVYLEEKDLFLLKILENYNYEIIKKEVEKTKKIICYEFENILDEIVFISEKIVVLINEGININNIKIVSLSKDYKNILLRVFDNCNLNLIFENENSIYSYEETQYFLNLLNNNNIKESYLNLIKNFTNNKITTAICLILNKYNFENLTKSFLEYEFKNNYINVELNNTIEVLPLNKVNSTDYVFIIGFNDDTYPKVYLDDDYLSDIEKEKLSIPTSIDKNLEEKEKLKNQLLSISNLVLSYSKNIDSKQFKISSITTSNNFEIIKDLKLGYTNFKNTKFQLAYELDKFNKFKIKTQNFNYISKLLDNSFYKSFDNRFLILSKSTIIDLTKKLSLSYNSLNNYYKCNYKFLLDNLIKLDEFKNEKMIIGNLFHFCLEKLFKNEYDEINIDIVKKFSDEFYEDRKLNGKDKIFKKIYENKILEVAQNIFSQTEKMSFISAFFEKELYYEMDGVPIKSIADKICISDNLNDEYAFIVDYKTGSFERKYDLIDFGIDTQLLFYAYLISKTMNYKIAGFYFQKTLYNKEINKNEVKFMLEGYTIEDDNIVSNIDKYYNINSFIKSIKIDKKTEKLKNNEYVFDKVELKNNLEKIDFNIKNGIKKIKDGQFTINPKIYKKKNISCSFCQYYDICYKKYKDFDFLKGDNDGMD
ncbi:MAG: PD-(D/E)XK nuclease family protein [Bacilli bacterium]